MNADNWENAWGKNSVMTTYNLMKSNTRATKQQSVCWDYISE